MVSQVRAGVRSGAAPSSTRVLNRVMSTLLEGTDFTDDLCSDRTCSGLRPAESTLPRCDDEATIGSGGRVARISAWRVNDAVAYEAMRESATLLTSLLLQSSTESSEPSAAALSELQQLHRDILDVDGHDRAAVNGLADRIAVRIAELTP